MSARTPRNKLQPTTDPPIMTQQKPLRVLVIVSQRSALWSKARESAEDLVPAAIQLVKDNQLYSSTHEILVPAARFVAMQKWRTRIFFVFDICHFSYDPQLGHLPEHNRLPVVVARFSKKQNAYVANAWISRRVNRDVALLHNANGFGAVPPFVEDHTLGKVPEYLHPRDVSLL